MLRRLLETHEGWLVERVIAYARRNGYSRFTATLREPWRMAVASLSGHLGEAFSRLRRIPELGDGRDDLTEGATLFTLEQVRSHRARGVEAGMFLGLMKHIRQGYLDLLAEKAPEGRQRNWLRAFVNRFFDRLELTVVAEWAHHSQEALLAELRKTNRCMAEEKNGLLALFESLTSPVLLFDPQGKIGRLNRAAARLFRETRPPGAPYARGSRKEGALAWLAAEIEEFAENGALETIFEKSYEMGGATLEFEIRFSRIVDAAGRFTGTAVTLTDVTARKQAERETRLLAYFDTLTGLPNRALFRDRLDLALAQLHRSKKTLALLFVDLDRFKSINDTLGHAAGDQLLREISLRLEAAVRKGDTVARLGGDEFVVLLPALERPDDAAAVSAHLLRALNEPFELAGHEVYITACIGLALAPVDGETADQLLTNADLAMYAAKEAGRNTFQYYSAELNHKVKERHHLETSLHRALQQQQFSLCYQPQIDLVSGKMTGVEALLRWNHPQRGMIPPGQFIPLAEENGLINDIGEWVLRTACAQARVWQEAGHPPVRMAVNLSGHQFNHPDLVGLIDRILAETGLSPDLLELELTESVLMVDARRAAGILSSFKERGIHVAIDDFGTGYSSLSYLKNFPIDRIKIAQCFVRSLGFNTSDATIVETIIAMARSLGIRIIAEGVETLAQLSFLRSRHCVEMQGHYFCRPLPADEFAQVFAAVPSRSGSPLFPGALAPGSLPLEH